MTYTATCWSASLLFLLTQIQMAYHCLLLSRNVSCQTLHEDRLFPLLKPKRKSSARCCPCSLSVPRWPEVRKYLTLPWRKPGKTWKDTYLGSISNTAKEAHQTARQGSKESLRQPTNLLLPVCSPPRECFKMKTRFWPHLVTPGLGCGTPSELQETPLPAGAT